MALRTKEMQVIEVNHIPLTQVYELEASLLKRGWVSHVYVGNDTAILHSRRVATIPKTYDLREVSTLSPRQVNQLYKERLR